MQLEHVTLAMFTAFNAVRLIAYLPQIHKLARDRNGTSSVAYSTWVMFFFANAATVAYAIVNQKDTTLAIWFACNAMCCLAIIIAGLAAKRRHRMR